MESYIVRIYRYRSRQPERLVGTIQGNDNPVPMAFTGVEELWEAIRHMAHLPAESESSTQSTHPEAHE